MIPVRRAGRVVDKAGARMANADSGGDIVAAGRQHKVSIRMRMYGKLLRRRICNAMRDRNSVEHAAQVQVAEEDVMWKHGHRFSLPARPQRPMRSFSARSARQHPYYHPQAERVSGHLQVILRTLVPMCRILFTHL